jgi:hypothetical protein
MSKENENSSPTPIYDELAEKLDNPLPDNEK